MRLFAGLPGVEARTVCSATAVTPIRGGCAHHRLYCPAYAYDERICHTADVTRPASLPS